MDKFVIWSGDIDIDDWKDCIAEELMTEDDDDISQILLNYEDDAYNAWSEHCDEHPEFEEMKVKDYRKLKDEFIENWKKDNPVKLPTVDEYIKENNDKCWEHIRDRNNDYLDDERMNLDIETNGRIMVLTDLGLWNGRRTGYGYARENNINSCLISHLRSERDSEFWVEYNDNGELEFKSKDVHHDGTNYYTYRELKPDLTDDDIEEFEGLVYEGKATADDIQRYTLPLGDRIQKVYGFELEKNVDASGPVVSGGVSDDEPLDLTGDNLKR